MYGNPNSWILEISLVDSGILGFAQSRIESKEPWIHGV